MDQLFQLPRRKKPAGIQPLLPPEISTPASPVKSGFAVTPESNIFQHYLRCFSRYRGTLLAGLAAGLVLAALVSVLTPHKYRSRAAIEVQEVNSDFLNTRQVNPIQDPSSQPAFSEIQTQLQILESDDLQNAVLDSLTAEGKAWSFEQESQGRFFKRTGPELRHSELETIKKDLLVRQVGLTQILEITFTSTNPQFAAAYLQELLRHYVYAGLEERIKMNESTGQYLAGELKKAQAKLENSQKELEEYARTSGLLYATPTVGGTEKTNVAEEKLRELQESLSKAEADLASTQSRYEVARVASPDTLADVLNDESLKDLQTDINGLQRQLAEASSIYTAKDEKVEAFEVQIDSLKKAFAKKRDEILGSIRNEYQASELRVKILQDAYNAQAAVVTQQSEKSIRYNSLKEQAESDRQLYNNMLEHVKQIGIASTVRANNIRIVDSPNVPFAPFTPNYPVNAALGLCLGLLAGSIGVVIRDRSNSVLHEPGDAGFWTNIPELGVVPRIWLETRRRAYPQLVPVARVIPGGDQESPKPENAPGVLAPALPPVSDKDCGAAAEAFRGILTSILLTRASGSQPRVLVITSPGPAEGKTFVVSHLAIAMAEVGVRVLLIDADLRSPGIHKLFKLDNTCGLTSLLLGRTGQEDLLFDPVQDSGVNNLSILASGPGVADPASLLYSRRMQELLQGYRRKFEVVLIDTPPGLHIADARIVSRLADAVVLVARSGETSRLDLLALQQRFVQDQTPVLGSILNKWKSKKAAQAYYPSTGTSGSPRGVSGFGRTG